MLQIYCKNNQSYIKVENGSSLLEILRDLNLQMPYPVVSAKVNNKAEGLTFRVYTNKDVEFLDLTDPSGMRTYVRSVCFVLYKAVNELFPQGEILMEHPVSNGYFCDLRIDRKLNDEDVLAIKQKMQEIIDADLPFKRVEQHTEDAIALFRKLGMMDKVRLLETSKSIYTHYYILDGTIDYYYGALLPSTGYIRLFDLLKYEDGLLLLTPDRNNPDVLPTPIKQEKMFAAFKEQVDKSKRAVQKALDEAQLFFDSLMQKYFG